VWRVKDWRRLCNLVLKKVIVGDRVNINLVRDQ